MTTSRDPIALTPGAMLLLQYLRGGRAATVAQMMGELRTALPSKFNKAEKAERMPTPVTVHSAKRELLEKGLLRKVPNWSQAAKLTPKGRRFADRQADYLRALSKVQGEAN